jgi:hypothetical protein
MMIALHLRMAAIEIHLPPANFFALVHMTCSLNVRAL